MLNIEKQFGRLPLAHVSNMKSPTCFAAVLHTRTKSLDVCFLSDFKGWALGFGINNNTI